MVQCSKTISLLRGLATFILTYTTMTNNNLPRRRPATTPFRSFLRATVFSVAFFGLIACDEDTESYDQELAAYQHRISLDQAFISMDNVQRSITMVGHHGNGHHHNDKSTGDATLRLDIVDDPADANVLFTCLTFQFDEDLAREIDAAERLTGVKGSIFRLPVLNNGGNLRIESLPVGPNLNELMNIRGADQARSFRRVHLSFWSQDEASPDLLHQSGSEAIFRDSQPGADVQDALNSAYGLLDMFVANSDTLYARLYQESELETNPETTEEIRD